MVVFLVDVSYIVIDEVYECSLDMDFLLSIVCDVFYKWRDFKFIFMSVIFDVFLFRDYFMVDK